MKCINKIDITLHRPKRNMKFSNLTFIDIQFHKEYEL